MTAGSGLFVEKRYRDGTDVPSLFGVAGDPKREAQVRNPVSFSEEILIFNGIQPVRRVKI